MAKITWKVFIHSSTVLKQLREKIVWNFEKIDQSLICVLFILYGIFTDLNENNSEETKEILINTWVSRCVTLFNLLGFDRWQTTIDDQCSVSEPSDQLGWIIIKPPRSRKSPFSMRPKLMNKSLMIYTHTTKHN